MCDNEYKHTGLSTRNIHDTSSIYSPQANAMCLACSTRSIFGITNFRNPYFNKRSKKEVSTPCSETEKNGRTYTLSGIPASNVKESNAVFTSESATDSSKSMI